MPIADVLTQTATIRPKAAGSGDTEGNSVPAYGTAVDEACRLEQTDTVEVLSGELLIQSNWRIFLLADSAITSEALVTVDDDDYRVVGNPSVETTPRGPHHVEARLTKVKS